MGRPTSGRGPGQAKDPATTEKAIEALKFKRAGLSYDQIAEQLGYTHRASAYNLIKTYLADAVQEASEETLAVELSRLDAMLVGLWPKASTGHPESVRSVLGIMDRRAKYLGLDDLESRMASVAERRVALEEAQAIVLVSVISRILERLDLTTEQRVIAQEAVPQELRLIETTQGEQAS